MTRAATAAVIDPWSHDSPAATSPRTFTGNGHRYTMTLTELPISLELERPRWDKDSLFGLLTVRTELTGARAFQGILLTCSFNCSAPGTRKQVAGRCKEMSKAPQIDWEFLLEEFSIRVLQAESQGEPAVDLRLVSPPDPSSTIDVQGIRIFEKHPIILFGDGGTFKSYLGLYIAGTLAQRGLSVMYADWELDASDHRARLELLFGVNMPLIHYVRCNRPLTAEVDRLARLARELDVAYLVCDSVVFACDGPPEASEVAMRYFQCIRRIGIGSLHLAHTNKSDESDKKPFGSAFWHNGARSTWNVKLSSEPSTGLSEITLGFYNRKSNLGGLLPAVGLRVGFEARRTMIEPVSLADVGGDLAAGLPLWQRMKPALTQPKTIAMLAEELEASQDSIKKAAQRKPNTFCRVTGDDGIHRLALVSSR